MRAILSAMAVVVLATVVGLGAGTAEAKDKEKDKKEKLKDRTPVQVLDDLRFAISIQDWESFASNYAEDAFVVDDQGVLIGHDEIVNSRQSLEELFDYIPPVISSQDVYLDTVRVLYARDAGWVVIPDGVDTYVIEQGLIRRQTHHGLIEFTGPPPE